MLFVVEVKPSSGPLLGKVAQGVGNRQKLLGNLQVMSKLSSCLRAAHTLQDEVARKQTWFRQKLSQDASFSSTCFHNLRERSVSNGPC